MNDDSDDAVVGKKKNPDTADDIGMASENTASGQSSLTGVDHDSAITDHYETLGLGRYASISDVRRAYRRLAARLHPDRNCSGDVEQNKGTSDAFCAVSAAYEILGEESRKDAYDAQLRHSVLGNTSANAHEDSLEAIRRDRERVKEMSRVNRVPLSAYAPGDAVLKQMREAIRHEGQHHTSHHPPASTAIHPFCPSQSEHFHESRSFITQNAVEELIRQRHQQDAERRELLADIDRLHAEAEQERERRRREREEKKKTLSWMLQSDHQQGTVSKKCSMSSTADAAHTDESVLGFDKRAWLHTHDSSPSTAKHLSDETHEKQRFDSMDDTTLSILLPKTGLRALPEKGISTDEESGHPLCVDCVLIPADEKLQKMYRDDPHNAHVELTRLENVMKHKLSVITSLLR